MKDKIFEDNISDIILGGHSEKLKKILEANPNLKNKLIENLNINYFSVKCLSVLDENPKFGDKTLLELFVDKLAYISNIIESGFFDGLRYIYENISESRNFIEKNIVNISEDVYLSRIFDMNFINNMGNDTLRKLYNNADCLKNKQILQNIFKISNVGNFELIKDIINFDSNVLGLKLITDKDINSNLIEIDMGYNKSELFLNKFMGIEKKDIEYIRIFLQEINKNHLPDSFREKYEEILSLLNTILGATDEEIISMSKSFDKSKKEGYRELINQLEKDGNNVIRENFSNELQIRYNQMNSSVHASNCVSNKGNVYYDNNGQPIVKYELTGQPFTLLIHALSNNEMSPNNHLVKQILDNPENWNNISGGNKFISTSLISDKYFRTYGAPQLIYGFSSLSEDSIKYMDSIDAGTNREAGENHDFNMRESLFFRNINTVTSIDTLVEETAKKNSRWNEVLITRRNNDGSKRKPDYIVCMDNINGYAIRAAKYFCIPIYVIHTNKYNEKQMHTETSGLVYDNDQDSKKR